MKSVVRLTIHDDTIVPPERSSKVFNLFSKWLTLSWRCFIVAVAFVSPSALLCMVGKDCIVHTQKRKACQIARMNTIIDTT